MSKEEEYVFHEQRGVPLKLLKFRLENEADFD
jgi:hypothetical protein